MSLIDATYPVKEDLELVLQLIRNGANVNSTDGNGSSPLNWAAYRGHYDVCKALLKNGAQVNTLNDSRWSPLMWAIYYKHVNVVRLLLHNGASLEVIGFQNKRPLDIAKEWKLPQIVEVIEKEFPLWLRLYHAARQGNYGECLALLEHKALHETTQDGLYCPLTAATKKGHVQIVKLLLDKGAKINCEDHNERNPMYVATKKGHKDIVTLLLNHGGNENTKVNGDTLLHMATRNNHEDLVRFFIQYEVNPNVKNNDGYTPLHYAIINSNGDIVNQLIQHHADINLATNNLETPLHLACEGGHDQTVEILLRNGANTEALNGESDRPIDVIKKKCSIIEVVTQVKLKILDNINALLIPPEAANSTAFGKGATRLGHPEIRRDSFEGVDDSISDATVEYPLSTFGSMKPDLSSRILETTDIKELNTKITELSALVLELNEKTVNSEIAETDLALERDILKHLKRKIDNTCVLKRLKAKDSKYEEALEQLTRLWDESKRKQAELEEEVQKFQTEISLIKTEFKDVFREITRILNKIEVVCICQ